ncbi:MAG: hypothetical protein U0893_24800 [Chloroflexota bacterium]
MQDRGRTGRPPAGGSRGGGGRPSGRRPISPRSPLEGRQLWRIGDWGGASEQIGRQWERLGAQCLETLVGVERTGPDGEPYLPLRALVLAAEPELAAQVQAHGKSHADAILIGTQRGRPVLEPVDFKWTLETANPRQVSAEVLTELLTEPPVLLATRLAEALAELPASDEPHYHDGIFLAPDHAENRAQLAPVGPLDPAWAVLFPIDAAELFPPLVGWDVAQAMARTDGAFLGTVEASERYYRLGAGVLGALRRLQSSVFDDTLPTLDGPAELARLRRERRLTTTGEVIAYFDRALTARSEVVDRLREVERAAYPYGRFREDLTARGLTTTPNNDRRWSRVYGSVMKELAGELRAEGRRLRTAGSNDATVLAELDGQRARWLARGRALLDQRLAARQEQE